ncbi:MAG: UTP--glucose-1-phosphate uridylyltransferase GalU [Euryarchaeota archaeon]|nr:UTP--glucose-1-phosphate uridylyltransferase GalU [Euryarchaeota archaeon]
MITKAVIPAAGLGTRFLPVTKSMPKEMLPIIDKPIIQFAVEEAIASGIEDIIIITGRGKRAIEDYFDTSPELESHLVQNKKYELLREVKDISSLVDIHYIRQKEPKGLGDAVLKAEKHVGDEPFAVLLGDDIIKCDSDTPCCIKQLMDLFEQYDRDNPIIAVEMVPEEKIGDYGIIKIKGKEIDLDFRKSVYRIEDIIEKPSLEEAPSNVGTVGRYILTPEIFDCIKETPPGKGNEIQLTDAIRLLIEKDKKEVYAYKFRGKRYDAGDKFGYVKAIVDFALERADLRGDIAMYLRRMEKASPQSFKVK